MSIQFADRQEAGKYLARKLRHWTGNPQVVVLALPRGGAPVAHEIAKELEVPLDVFIVRKLGVPIQKELAMGAIASGGVRVLNEEVIQQLGITSRTVDAATVEQQYELERQERAYRDGRRPLEVAGRVAILVDDGLATGTTMRAAVRALRQKNPQRIIVAVPVGAREICEQFLAEADEVLCGIVPKALGAVGQWYENFAQTEEEEVRDLLDRHSVAAPW